MNSDNLIYHVNDTYEIVYLDEAWDSLVLENNAPQLCAENILGRNLFDFIADEKVRYLYHTMFEKILNAEISFKFTYRCDTPDRRRLFALETYRVKENVIELRNTLLSIELRNPIELLNPDTLKNDQYLRICSWCKKTQLDNEQWVEIEEAIQRMRLFERRELPNLTHTICKPCFERQMAEIAE